MNILNKLIYSLTCAYHFVPGTFETMEYDRRGWQATSACVVTDDNGEDSFCLPWITQPCTLPVLWVTEKEHVWETAATIWWITTITGNERYVKKRCVCKK